MDAGIDLDDAARQIAVRRMGWEGEGLGVGPVTWRDRGRRWPDHIVSNRSQASDPDSVGVNITRGDQEGRVVFYIAGWAEIHFWDGDQTSDIVNEVIGSSDAPLLQCDVGRVMDTLVARFRVR